MVLTFPWFVCPGLCVILFALLGFELTAPHLGYPSTFDWQSPYNAYAILIYILVAFPILVFAMSLSALIFLWLSVVLYRWWLPHEK